MNITLVYWIGGWLISTCIVYTGYCLYNKGNKIKIMSVRSELKKIKRMDDADKKSLF